MFRHQTDTPLKVTKKMHKCQNIRELSHSICVNCAQKVARTLATEGLVNAVQNMWSE